MMKANTTTAILAIVFASAIFGLLGVFNRYFLTEWDLNSIDVAFIRLSITALALLIILAVLSRDKLRVTRRDVPLLILFAAFKLLADVCFFFSMKTTSLCLATLLQMTAPYFVMVASFLLFKEKLTMRKLVATIMASIGCICITGVLLGGLRGDIIGILAATLSGLFYGLYLVGNKITLDRGIHPATTLFYVALFSLPFSMPFINLPELGSVFLDPTAVVMALGLGLGLTLIPFYIIAWGVAYVPPTTTSVINMVEVASAAIVGLIFYGEALDIFDYIGLTLVFLSVLFINNMIHNRYTDRVAEHIPPKIRKAMAKLESDEPLRGSSDD